MGYPSGLSSVGTYDAGKALYYPYGVLPIVMDPTKMCRAVARVESVSGVTLTCDNITNYPNPADTTFAAAPSSFTGNEFNHGFVRMLSGALTSPDEDNVYKIVSTDEYDLETDTDLAAAGADVNDYLECVTGACHYEFPAGRNPTRRDFKRTLKAEIMRFPYHEAGLAFPVGYENDDFVISTYVTTQLDFDRLQMFLAHYLDYKGFDAMASTGSIMDNVDGIAPVILETGSMDIMNQYLGVINDFKFIKDAKKGDTFWELLIHLYNVHTITYRGI